MSAYDLTIADGATVDSLLTTVRDSNLSATHKITRSATIVIAASDSSAKSKAQADIVCDGIDDDVDIQAALNELPDYGGKVQLLEGNFSLDASTSYYLNSSKCGINIHGSNIELNGSTGTVLKLKTGLVVTGTTPTFPSILTIDGSNIKISNIIFDGNTSNVTATDIHAIWTGGETTTAKNVEVFGCHFQNCKGWCIYGDGGGNSASKVDVSFWNIHHNTFDVLETVNGMSFHNGPQFSIFSNNVIKNPTYGEPIHTGIMVDSVQGCIISNNVILNPTTYGIQIYDFVNNCIINNNIITGHETWATSQIGIYVASKGSNEFACTNNMICNNSLSDLITGLKINDSYVSNTTVIGNHIDSVATPMINYGTNTIIKNNTGYITENTSTATITTGQTSVNVAHGLAAAPTRVQLTPTTATAGKQFYVSAKAASTFTITIDSAHSADISFDWQAAI